MGRRIWLALALAIAAVSLALFAVACNNDDGDGGDATPTVEEPTPTDAGSATGDEADIEAAVKAAIAAYTGKDVAGFVAAFTDQGLSQLFDVSIDELEGAKADLANFIGESPPEFRSLHNTIVTGTTAQTELETVGDGTIEIDRLGLIKEGDVWKIDEYEGFAVSPEIPEGYTTVDLHVAEFAFAFTRQDVTTGKVAFAVTNAGEQKHETALFRVAADFDLDAALQDDSGAAFDAAEFVGRIEIQPGTQSNMVLVNDLTASRYLFVCFMPDTSDPEETPHALKGMWADFTVE